MPYDGQFTDYFEARCRAVRNDRSQPKIRDLMRGGPYRGKSWHHDVVTFSLRLADRLTGKPFPVGFLLRDELKEVAREPTRMSLLFVHNHLASPETSRHLPRGPHQAATLRVNYYLAAIGHEKATEHIIIRCLDLATTAQTPEIKTDFIRAALGWAFILKGFEWPQFSSGHQTHVRAAGEDMLLATFEVMAKRYGGLRLNRKPTR